MTNTTLKLIDLYELNPNVFNTDELVQKEVNIIIEHRQFKKQALYFKSL